jgi:serine protease
MMAKTLPFIATMLLSVSALAAAPQKISGQWIIELNKPTVGSLDYGLSVAQQAQNLVAPLGGQVTFTYEHALRGFAVRLPDAAIPLLKLNPLVKRVEQDQVMSASATQTGVVWGIDRIDQRNLPLNGQYTYPDQAGQGVHAYILDTGINPNHTEFTGRIAASRNFVPAASVTTADPNAWTDCQGHGTHVAGTTAGTLYGVAKKALVHTVRVLDCQGSGSNSGVIAGVDWVTANHVKPAVANMSLGGGDSSALDTAVVNLVRAGVTVAVAAGNDSKDACSGSPNKVPQAVTVGSTVRDDTVSSFSNRGTCLDIFAPGSDVISANHANNTGTTTMSGTSMASPHVAGAAALVLGANPSFTPQQVRDRLVADATSDKLTGTQARSGSALAAGYGASPNKLLFIGNVGGGAPAPTDAAPVANFSSSPSGLTVSFDASASTDDKGIASYGWNFGDGSSGTGRTVSRTYAAGGTYTVTLTVTDTVHQTHARSQAVTVTAPSNSVCSDCTQTSGTLAVNGTAYNPSSSGFSSNGGAFKGFLRGPAGTDFDLYLEKLSTGLLGGWSVVARSEANGTSSEQINYTGTAGTYRWRVYSYAGAGRYDLYVKNP